MFDFAGSEIALIGIVALIFIGPKDMPTAIRAVTNILKKGRKLAGEFQTHVDEMVREADLGEARDSFRQLRSMNLRGQIMRTLDSDGGLRRTLTENPLSPVPAAAATALPGAVDIGTAVSGQSLLDKGTVSMPPPYRPAPHAPDEAIELAESTDPAPVVIPPRTAARLRRERAAAPPPWFLPPSASRPQASRY
ncbi:Sec-independent protein translocase protein TatB [Lichenicoccus roseus]|uniref:Twin-arginine translocase subunit TatB n=1 Tax=Lichenicoccus roseus TaxID=2683649 RepID=A0A5R9J679_9PROT|nr:Sec-independent protein translocase protein TatB [Lichenicoccus roseus]TLU72469.1 twin-arginine translocase subunit TatB [Lichenicoccus roseus]